MKTETKKESRAIKGFSVLKYLWKLRKEEAKKKLHKLSYAELMQYFDDREREYAEKGIFLKPA